MEDKILHVESLRVTLEGHEIIHNVSFNVRPGEVIAVIGPNGAGKSVLLKTLVGIIKKTSGTIVWKDGVKVGFLPQRFQVDRYLPMTVKEFLELQPDRKIPLEEALTLTHFNTDLKQKTLAHLSGGEMQKVLLAWSILNKPDILLFDEPTENIDVVSQESVYALLHHLEDKLGVATILVSHDLHVVYRYATRVICLNNNMICEGPPDTVLTTKKLGELYGDYAFFHHHHDNLRK